MAYQKVILGKMHPPKNMSKKENPNKCLIDKYGSGQYSQIAHRSAVDVSNNMKCWWVYQWMMNYKPINWAKRRDY